MSTTQQEHDWRIEAVAKLESDLPPAYPGGPSFARGSNVFMSSTVGTSNGGSIGFAAPNMTAMALNLAINAAREASAIRSTIAFKGVPSPEGICQMISLEGSAAAFSMFEQSLSAITFSFLALEAYCNYVISRNWKKPIKIKGRKGRPEVLSPIEAERVLSTEVKIKSVLPEIFDVPTPAGKAIWGRFIELKKVRDDSVHIKYSDQYPLGATEKEGIFFQIFNGDPHTYPETAIEIIQYFYKTAQRPQWLERVPPVRVKSQDAE